MEMKFFAKANTAGATLYCNFYCLDSGGNVIGGVIGSAGAQVLTTGMTGYTFDFVVPSDSRIKSNEPILYNGRFSTNPSDTIYLDNVSLKPQVNLIPNGTFDTNVSPGSCWAPVPGPPPAARITDRASGSPAANLPPTTTPDSARSRPMPP